MSFCTGCTHFLHKEIHSIQLPDKTYSRGPAYMCNNERAIRASQKEPDTAITILPIGRVCWTCRGAFYIWDGATSKPHFIVMLEASKKAILEELTRQENEKKKEPEHESARGIKTTPKTKKLVSRKTKKREDPSKKRKSMNQGLI